MLTLSGSFYSSMTDLFKFTETEAKLILIYNYNISIARKVMLFVLHGTKQLTTSIKFPHPKTMLDSTVTFFCSRTQVVVAIHCGSN